MTKLTLSMDQQVVELAKRLARRRKTSVSAMFSNIVKSMAAQDRGNSGIPPDSITARLTGIIESPADQSDRDLLTQALVERYGIEEG